MNNNKHRLGASALGSGLEALEDRVVMSLSAVAPPDFVLDLAEESFSAPPLETMLSGAHAQTGLDNVRNEYGFAGAGQTVAVIDSGIAWDHIALGNGYGSDSRVVGGWDFTENDADPYDDGLMGSHGTHVAGIIGSDSQLHTGVAPGVDLVALRVFDDNGDGYFHWVESALDWVHDNRNAFENPITTVNLSIGAEWNAETLPNWAMLEDEFAQLEADGIFIAVAAGNSFTSYNATGLSYPAVSEHVVPVMSVDDNGALSYFSQRHENAIAAPGSWITSSVPDYVGNQNGQADDFAAYSGTSMASPYIAGASVLMREALSFVGQTDVTQDQIYGIMRDTAESFYDAATNQNYLRFDFDAAIDSIMPDDEFGSTVGTAHSLGSLGDTASVSGLIGTLSDVDYFTFTADMSGAATFAASSESGTSTVWQAGDTTGVTDEDGNWTFDVVQGQTYTVGIASTDGLGYYSIDVDLESSFSFVDWGTIDFSQHADQSNSGEAWYRVAATRDGIFTAEAVFDHSAGNVDLEIYDASMNLIGTSSGSNDQERIDVSANADETFFIKVIGANSDIDFRLANLVSQDNDTVTVHGTEGDDTFVMTVGNQHELLVNGISYLFDAAQVNQVDLDGHAGNDLIHVHGTAADESTTLSPGTVQFSSGDFELNATGVETTLVEGGAGFDRAFFFDSASDDQFYGSRESGRMVGSNFDQQANGFERIYVTASSGFDRAHLNDSNLNDRYYAHSDHSEMRAENGEYANYVEGFDRTYAYANGGGTDRAYLYDSISNDRFYASPDNATMRASDYSYSSYVESFDLVYAYATSGGFDRAFLYDSTGADRFYATPEYAYLRAEDYSFNNYVQSFDRVYAYANNGGYDRAFLHDSAGRDRFYGMSGYATLQAEDYAYMNYAESFDRVYAYARNGGFDRAYLYDSVANDRFVAREHYSQMYDVHYTYMNYAERFERTTGVSSAGGYDRATLYDTAGNDIFSAESGFQSMHSASSLNESSGFYKTEAFASLGQDVAVFKNIAGQNSVSTNSGSVLLDRSHCFESAYGFDSIDLLDTQDQSLAEYAELLDVVFASDS